MKLYLPKNFMAVLLATVLGSPVTYGAATSVYEGKNTGASIDNGETVWSPENNVERVSYKNNAISGYGNGVLEMEPSSSASKKLTITGLETVEFADNTDSTTGSTVNSGGTIMMDSDGESVLNIDKNKYVSISSNTTKSESGKTYGGGIYMEGKSTTNITTNNQVLFNGNTVTSGKEYAYGGAIYAEDSSSVNLSNNGEVSFEGNKAVTEGKSHAGGGAISTKSGVTLKLNNNEQLIFKGNTTQSESAIATGGAISNDGTYGSTPNNAFEISGNKEVSFENNSAIGKPEYNNSTHKVMGGAIYTYNNNFSITDNNKVNFTGNYVSGVSGTSADSYAYSVHGGAIYVRQGLKIQGNDTVLFGGNYEVTDSGYRMRAIYGHSDTGFYMSANKGGSIELRDGISLKSLNANGDHNLYLNSAYGETEQSGKIIMTGAYTEKMLTDVKGTAGTAQEIADSRRFEVAGDVILNAGTLSLQDKALLSADTLIVKSGAAVEVVGGAQLEAATTFNLTEAVTLAATIDADLVMEANSSFTIVGGAVDMNGHDITIADGVTINYLVNDLNAILDIEQVLFENIGALNANELEIMFTDGTNYSKVEYEVKGNAVVAVIPEPTTATLSLLALAALAARRRRK